MARKDNEQYHGITRNCKKLVGISGNGWDALGKSRINKDWLGITWNRKES